MSASHLPFDPHAKASNSDIQLPPQQGYKHDLSRSGSRLRSGGRRDEQRPTQWRMKYRRQHQKQLKGGGEEKGDWVEQENHERRTDSSRSARSSESNNGNGPHVEGEARPGGKRAMTIDMIMHKCGRSLIEPSVVSAPMDFLTSEAEFARVWKV